MQIPESDSLQQVLSSKKALTLLDNSEHGYAFSIVRDKLGLDAAIFSDESMNPCMYGCELSQAAADRLREYLQIETAGVRSAHPVATFFHPQLLVTFAGRMQRGAVCTYSSPNGTAPPASHTPLPWPA